MALVAEDIKDAAKLFGTDLVIVLMGLTGTGKSNIIDTLAGQRGMRAGSRLESCTTEVHAVRLHNHPVHGDRLVLVDTPGFDNTNKSNVEILEMVSNWLQKIYEKDIKLAGIIYLHRITDNCMTGSSYRNLCMLGELCGNQAVKKVVLVTTMWDEVEREIGVRQEKWLFDNYWKTMINYGASTARFSNSADSAWRIVDMILKQHGTEVLLLQEELVDLKKPLNKTQAGMTLYSDLRLLAEQRDTVRSLESNPKLNWVPFGRRLIAMKWSSIFKSDIRQSDIVIVIIGPTGVGKSSFINIAADQKLTVNNSLSPCTTEFAYVRCTFEDSREVVFVDTPPFPDPDGNASASVSDEQKVGKNINQWVKEALGKRVKVTRILYLHDISMNRLTEQLPHYEIFRKLCGNQFSGSVALVLTMCENVDPATCQERTKYLKNHWKKMMGEKAVVYSHYGTKKSAWDVVAGLGVLEG